MLRPAIAHAVREQRGGDRIAGEGGERAAVPAEAERLGTIDVTAAREPVAHQCATPEAAPSSTSAPVVKRSSPKAAISSCGRPFAIVQAMVSPPAGIAL